MKVKHFLIITVLVTFIIVICVSLFVVSQVSTLDELEVEEHLEKLHGINIESTQRLIVKPDSVVYLLTTDGGLEFYAEVKKDAKGKDYVSTSTYNHQLDVNRYLSKFKTIESKVSELGFSPYTGGEKLRIEDDPNTPEDEYEVLDGRADVVQPIQVGVDSEGVERIGLSLTYEEPLTVFTINDKTDKFWLLVQLVKSLEFENPYISIKGMDDEFTSGQLILTDLDQLNSLDDVSTVIQSSLTKAMGDLPSITIDEE